MVSRYYKAIIAFVSLLAANVAAVAANPDIAGVLPASATGWLTMAATTLGGTVLVWLVRNEATVEEAEVALDRARRRF